MQMTDEIQAFNERLMNWRRVYGNSKTYWRSPTLIFCEYARANIESKKETERQKYWREQAEIKARDDPLPPLDYKDADLINKSWSHLPAYYYGLPIKTIIRAYVFDTYGEFRAILRKYGIVYDQRAQWTLKCLTYFKQVVDFQEHKRKKNVSFDF